MSVSTTQTKYPQGRRRFEVGRLRTQAERLDYEIRARKEKFADEYERLVTKAAKDIGELNTQYQKVSARLAELSPPVHGGTTTVQPPKEHE